MAKFISQSIIDTLFNDIASATDYHICSAQPASAADVQSVSLGSIAVDSSDYTIDGTGADRKITVSAKTLTASATGSMTHVAITNGTDLLVTTVSAIDVADQSTVNVGAFEVSQSIS